MLSEHRVEPDAALLANCRARLEEALDREEEGGWLRRRFGVFLPANWLSPDPAWSAALLVMIGFSVERSADISAAAAEDIAPSDLAPAPSSSISSFDLHNADVASINVFPSDA